MMIAYKLTDADMRTRNGMEWKINIRNEVEGELWLCWNGLHAYASLLLATFMHPVHASYGNPRLFRCEASDERITDGTKQCHRWITLLEELDMPVLTKEQRIRFGILAAATVCRDEDWRKWAVGWMDGSDRSCEAAWAAEAAEAAAWAARTARAGGDAADFPAIAEDAMLEDVWKKYFPEIAEA